jgi:uncharacterized protein
MKRTKKTAKQRPQRIERLRSIPADVVLSPQAQAPREGRGVDRSRTKRQVSELSWSEFDRKVQALARTIHADFKADAVVGIAHGGVFVGGALARVLELEFFPVRISRRSRDHVQKRPKAASEMPRELKGKKVLLVDDLASSGDTLELARSMLEKVGVKQVRTACLVRREEGFEPDWCGVKSDALILFPWDYEPVTEDGRFGL